mgnify:CR=1 FL=1
MKNVIESVGLEVELPMTVDIFRTAGRKFVTVKVYGVFDARLDEGEELSIQTSDGVIDEKIQANASFLKRTI